MTKHRDELIPSLSEGYERATDFINKRVGSISFGFITELEGEYFIHERWNQPCYGELRPYAKTHPDLIPEDQRETEKPTDLFSPFPEKGNPVVVFLAFYQHVREIETTKDFLSVILNPETSPWKHVLQDYTLIEDGDIPTGIIFRNTEISPTVLVSLWKYLQENLSKTSTWKFLRKAFPNENPNLLLLILAGGHLTNYRPVSRNTSPEFFQFNWQGTEYYLSPQIEFERFLNGDPIIEEYTFYDRCAYNRRGLHYIFGKRKESFYVNLKKLWKVDLAGYIPIEVEKEDIHRFKDDLVGLLTA